MRPGRWSQVGRRSSSQQPRCRWKNPVSPRSRAQLPFRRPRRMQHRHNQRLWLRPHRKTSRRPPPPRRGRIFTRTRPGALPPATIHVTGAVSPAGTADASMVADLTGAGRRRPVARVDAIAPVDRARSRNARASNRAAQGKPATNGPRPCKRYRSAQGEPGTNGPRHCQGFRGQDFRAEPAAEDVSASATADHRPGAQAGADALTIPRWPFRGAGLRGPPSTIPNASFWSAPTVTPFTVI